MRLRIRKRDVVLATALALGFGGNPGTGTLPEGVEPSRAVVDAPYLVMLAFHARPGLHLGLEVDGDDQRLVALDAETGAIEELPARTELSDLLGAARR